ncbi:MAG: hypothetical protein O2912_06675 [Proteobacteria bacterium]|nr:hypothetical protein [Pseudomonadota bacterium]
MTPAAIPSRRADHPSLLRECLGRELDLVSSLPRLEKFLRFRKAALDGKLFSVRVASAELPQPTVYRWMDGEHLARQHWHDAEFNEESTRGCIKVWYSMHIRML